jgi:arylsulfatase A-like enzyme
VLDFDRDGHAAVLGGGDCREFNAKIHPEARDIIRNGIDEDCDGQDQERNWILPGDAARRQRLARWREEDEQVRGFARRAAHMNILLVVVDALRADSFEPTAENTRAFPAFFNLRRRARWFTRAFSPAAGTDLSMTGVLTGKANPMTGSDLTLAEILTAAGYRSHAVIPQEVLRFISPTMLTRGVTSHDKIAAPNDGVSAAHTTALGLKFLDGWTADPDRPFFLWLHYFDVHEHDQIPSEAPAVVSANGGRPPRSRRDKYRTMVKVVDSALARLQQELAQRGLADNTIVILLSDHGESLRESPRLPEYHGRFLYNALVHEPMAVAVPGLEPAEISHPVSLLDVSHTVRDLLDVPGDDSYGDAEGESLLPLLVDAPPSLFEPPRVLPLNESDQYGIIAWPHKLLVRPGAELHELYDLSRDFAETSDLAEEQPELVRSLLRAYKAFPAVPLDRTTDGRRRWEMKAQASRPGKAELAALASRIPRPPVPGRWRPQLGSAASAAPISSISPISRKTKRRKAAAARAAKAAAAKATAAAAKAAAKAAPPATTGKAPPAAAAKVPAPAVTPAKPAATPRSAGRLQRARATNGTRPVQPTPPVRSLEKPPR